MYGKSRNNIFWVIFAFVFAIQVAPVLSHTSQVESSKNPALRIAEILSADVLEWNKTSKKDGDYYSYYLTSLSYRRKGKILWTRPLPDRMTSRAIERSYKKPVNIRSYHGFPFLLGTIFTAKTVAIADGSGVFILDRETGKVIQDKPSEPSPDLFFIDWGTATLTTPTEQCKFKINGGKFFQECGAYSIYFNGKNLWVWDRASKLIESTNYNAKIHKIETHRALTYQIKIPLKTVTVEIGGFVGE